MGRHRPPRDHRDRPDDGAAPPGGAVGRTPGLLAGAGDRGVPHRALHRRGARVQRVPGHRAGGDPAAAEPQRGHHAADPPARHRGARRGGSRGRGLRALRRRGQHPRRARGVPHPRGDQLRGDHQGRGARRRGGRALHPRRDARQADGDRRRPVVGRPRRRQRPQAAQRPRARGRLLRRHGRRQQVRARRRHRGAAHRGDQPRGRPRHGAHRGHGDRPGGRDLLGAQRGRRALVADPGAPDLRRGGHRGDARRDARAHRARLQRAAPGASALRPHDRRNPDAPRAHARHARGAVPSHRGRAGAGRAQHLEDPCDGGHRDHAVEHLRSQTLAGRGGRRGPVRRDAHPRGGLRAGGHRRVRARRHPARPRGLAAPTNRARPGSG